MASKTFAKKVKLDAARRILSKRSATADEARRYGVSKQAIRRWRAEFEHEFPDETAKLKAEAAGAAPSPAANDAPPPAPTPEASPAAASGDFPKPEDLGGGAAAVGLDGENDAPPTSSGDSTNTPPPPPPAPAGAGGDPDFDDMAVVTMAGNTLLGLLLRGARIGLGLWHGVRIPMTEEMKKLARLSDEEIAALRPGASHVARKVREIVGSNEDIAVYYTGSISFQALTDRWDEFRELVDKRLKPILDERARQAREAEEEKLEPPPATSSGSAGEPPPPEKSGIAAEDDPENFKP